MGPTLPVVVARPLVGVAHPPGKGGPIRPATYATARGSESLSLWSGCLPCRGEAVKPQLFPSAVASTPPARLFLELAATGTVRALRSTGIQRTFSFSSCHMLSSPTAGISSAVPPNCNVSTVKWKNLHHETRIFGEQILAKLVMTPHRNSLFFAAHFNSANVALAK